MREVVSITFAASIAGGALAAEPPEKVILLAISGGHVPAEQRVIKVARDDTIRLRATADVPGDLHLHGYRLELKLAPGRSTERIFKAYATGRYPFEWHPAGEKAKNAGRYGPEFAVIEVYPK